MCDKLNITLKEKQVEAILNLLSRHDVFVSLPTGYGKSIVYGVLPLAFDLLLGKQGSIVICVSPLTSLMMDQKQRFTSFAKGHYNVDFVGEEQLDNNVIKSVLSGRV